MPCVFVLASQELTVAAELASLVAGEDPIEIDRVKCFHDAAFGYAPFIYELTRGSTIEDVQKACKKVFNNLSRDPKLPEKYADSARNQAWFEKALETQNSVEKSSAEKVAMIEESGEFKVGHLKEVGEKTLVSIEDVVILTYKVGSEATALQSSESKKFQLHLSQVRELISKLMLILGQENHSDAKKAEHFMSTFQNIERVACAFVNLYNSGCTFFLNWQATIRVSPKEDDPTWEINYRGGSLKSLLGFSKDANTELSDLCLALEGIQAKWQDYVLKMRITHPVLNFFNIQQLKKMSHKLAEAQKQQHPIDEETLYLLRFINVHLTQTDVEKWLHDKQSSTENVSKENCVDKRLKFVSLLKILTENFNGDDTLAKAAIQATRGGDRDGAVSWAFENRDNREELEEKAQRFEEFVELVAQSEHNNIESTEDCGSQHELAVVFGAYLQSLNNNLLSDFMNLHQLGLLLNHCKAKETIRAQFPENLRTGCPNLIVCGKRQNIFPQILSLYRYASKESFPHYSQVLICNERTTVEELGLFILKATLDPDFEVHAIAFADEMSAKCADYFEKVLFEQEAPEMKREYKLVVFCSDENSQISVLLEKFKSTIGCESDSDLRSYLCENLKTQGNTLSDYRIRLITSNQPSSGKNMNFISFHARALKARGK